MASVNAAAATRQLKALANKEHAAKAVRYFKTGPGEYSEGDQFLGIRVPQIRQLEKQLRGALSISDMGLLLQNEWHEIRLFALIAMVNHYQRGDEKTKKTIVTTFFKLKKHINNWDLVDSSAHYISGAWHYDKDRSRLDKMINAKSLWDRRIAMMSTFYYIHQNDLDDTFRYAQLRLDDDQDLMHKATGWMLREAGKRNQKRLLAFIKKNSATMPRTMLRYAIEKLPEARRKQILVSTAKK